MANWLTLNETRARLFQAPVRLLKPWPDQIVRSTKTARAQGAKAQAEHTKRRAEEPRLTDEDIERLVREARLEIKRNLARHGVDLDYGL